MWKRRGERSVQARPGRSTTPMSPPRDPTQAARPVVGFVGIVDGSLRVAAAAAAIVVFVAPQDVPTAKAALAATSPSSLQKTESSRYGDYILVASGGVALVAAPGCKAVPEVAGAVAGVTGRAMPCMGSAPRSAECRTQETSWKE